MNDFFPMINICVCSGKKSELMVDGNLKRKYEDDYAGGVRCMVKKRNYNMPANSAKISELSHKNYADQSQKKIRWAVGIYDEWRINRMKELYVSSEIRNTDMAFVTYFSKSDLCHSLSRFITEVKKIDNSDFPGKTLREIIIMIQMHLHQNGVSWKLLDGDAFKDLRNIVDNTMKDRDD